MRKNTKYHISIRGSLAALTALMITLNPFFAIIQIASVHASGGSDLLLNPSFEEANQKDPSLPSYWSKKQIGKNSADFIYPAEGKEGKGIGIEIKSFTSGHAEWIPDFIRIKSGISYIYSEQYKSDTISYLVAQFKKNGKSNYVSLGTIPSAAEWTSLERSFTMPKGFDSVSVFHLLRNTGSLYLDDASISLENQEDDRISLVSPMEGQAVSGIFRFQADVGEYEGMDIQKIQFFIDGVPDGKEVVSAPYISDIDTTKYENGSHEVVVSLRDGSGKRFESVSIPFEVKNPIPVSKSPKKSLTLAATSSGTTAYTGNIISNPSVESVSTKDKSLPMDWNTDEWGKNEAVFTYPVVGQDGEKGMKVEMKSYKKGDAKWYFKHVDILPGKNYTFSDCYRSDVDTNVILEYKMKNGEMLYTSLGDIPASSEWTKFTKTFFPPENAKKVSVLHLLKKKGYLITDNYSLALSSSDMFAPTMSITSPADDSKIAGKIQITASGSDNIGIVGVQFMVDGEAVGKEIMNPPYSYLLNSDDFRNGVHKLIVKARDAAGNISKSEVIKIHVSNHEGGYTPSNGGGNGGNGGGFHDNSAPSVNIVEPYSGATLSGSVMLLANATDNIGIKEVSFYLDELKLGKGTGSGSNYSMPLDSRTLPNGQHMIFAKAIDEAGNINSAVVAVKVENVNPDVTPPSIQIISPIENKTLSGSIMIMASGSDDRGIVGVQFMLDGAKLGSEILSLPYSYAWDTTKISNGIHKLSIIARDAAGNSKTSSVVSVTVDNVISDNAPPSISITSPSENKTLSGTILITASGSDNRGIVGVQFMLDGTGIGSEITSLPYAYSWDTTKATNGVHNISVIAKDAAGNFGSGSVSINILNNGADTTPPVIAIASPEDQQTLSGTITLVATGSDDRGIAGVRFMLDGTGVGSEITSLPYSYSWDTTKVSNGSHKISVIARDAAGNSATGATITINIINQGSDTIAPVVVWEKPSVGSTSSGAVEFKATAMDDKGVIDLVFFVDNTAIGTGQIGTGTSNSYSLLYDSTKLTNTQHSAYAEARDAAGNIGRSTPMQFNISNLLPDDIPPQVSIASPANGAILSGTSSISINATDNQGIAFVHYDVSNGTDLITGEFTQTPYVLTLPPTALKNGSHTINVYAKDLAGNIGNATPITFNTFYNPPVPLNPNIILNPSFESVVGGIPDHWFKSSWGTNTTAFNYPVQGIEGSSAAELTISAYTDGDAKWYFEDVEVSSGQTYEFSDMYKSTTLSYVTARYTMADGTFSYPDIISNLPASSDWVRASQTFVVPAGAVKITMFHLIKSVGSLTIDDAALRLSSGTPTLDVNALTTGMVSLTFDDGWASQYDSAFPILNAAGYKGSFYMITNEMKNAFNENRLTNPSVEVESSGKPSGWSGSITGSNEAAFTYPVTGVLGGKAIKVEMTAFTSGEAEWIPNETTIVNGEIYNFTDQYMSDVPTIVTVRYTLNNGTTTTADIGTLPASPSWKTTSLIFKPIANVKTLSVYHKLVGQGYLITDDYHLDQAQGYMDTAQAKEIYLAGHEVSSHTQTHTSLITLDPIKAANEISGSRQDLINVGISPSNTFVYPYGDQNASVVQLVKDAGYIGARSVEEGYNNKATDRYVLKIQQVNNTTTPQQWESWVQTAMANHTWLIIMFHQVDGQNDQYGTTPENLQTFVEYLKSNGIPVVTMGQGIGVLNGQ